MTSVPFPSKAPMVSMALAYIAQHKDAIVPLNSESQREAKLRDYLLLVLF